MFSSRLHFVSMSSELTKVKLDIYEHLDTMNECCHHKGKRTWTFLTRETQNHCHETCIETQSSHSELVKKLCPSCTYNMKKLSVLNQKLKELEKYVHLVSLI